MPRSAISCEKSRERGIPHPGGGSGDYPAERRFGNRATAHRRGLDRGCLAVGKSVIALPQLRHRHQKPNMAGKIGERAQQEHPLLRAPRECHPVIRLLKILIALLNEVRKFDCLRFVDANVRPRSSRELRV